MARPYLTATILALEDLVRREPTDSVLLREIAGELAHRSSRRSTVLAGRGSELRAALEAKVSATPQAPASKSATPGSAPTESVQIFCPRCEGTGNENRCAACGGTGSYNDYAEEQQRTRTRATRPVQGRPTAGVGGRAGADPPPRPAPRGRKSAPGSAGRPPTPAPIAPGLRGKGTGRRLLPPRPSRADLLRALARMLDSEFDPAPWIEVDPALPLTELVANGLLTDTRLLRREYGSYLLAVVWTRLGVAEAHLVDRRERLHRRRDGSGGFEVIRRQPPLRRPPGPGSAGGRPRGGKPDGSGTFGAQVQTRPRRPGALQEALREAALQAQAAGRDTGQDGTAGWHGWRESGTSRFGSHPAIDDYSDEASA